MRSILDDIGPTDSQFVLFYRRAKERRDQVAAEILSGQCQPATYNRLCGAYQELNQIVLDMEAATRGENRPIRRPEPVKPVEEY